MGSGSGAGMPSGQEVEVGFDLDGLVRGLERFCNCGFTGSVAGEGRIVGVEGLETSGAAFFGFVVLDFALLLGPGRLYRADLGIRIEASRRTVR